MTFDPKKCLVIGPSWVGDMVMAQSLFIVLKKKYPMMSIDVLAPAWSKPILAAMPEVSDALEFPFVHGELDLAGRWKLGYSLREKQYDWGIVLPNSLKSVIPLWAANIKRRTGYKGEMRYGLLNDIRSLDKHKLTQTVQRFVGLAFEGVEYDGIYPYPSLDVNIEAQKQACKQFNINRSRPLVAICPGAEYGPAKRWPDKHVAVFAAQMMKLGYQVVLLGSEKDRVVTDAICTLGKLPENVNLAGKTQLSEVIGLLAQADVAVTNDSGLMHIAAAVGTQVIAIYGSSDPNFTPPLSKQAEVISLGLSCSPCFKRECPLGTLACLEGIEPVQVLRRIQVSEGLGS